MSMAKRIAPLIFLAASLLPGCRLVGHEEETDSFSHDPALLTGTWIWERSTYFETSDGKPNVATPESSGHTERLVFTADMRLLTYRNGELISDRPYATEESCTDDGSSCTATLVLDFGLGAGFQPIYRVSEARLIISTAPVDGPESEYSRSR